MSLIQTSNQSNGIFMKISNGTINFPTTAEDPNAVEVKYTDQKTKEVKSTYKIIVPSLLGRIVKTEYVDGKYGHKLDVTVRGSDQDGIIQIKSDGSLHNAFINLLINLDVNKDVKISSWSWNDRTYVGFEQDGVKVAPYSTRDNPQDVPQPLQTEHLGSVKWDFAPVNQFYYNYIVNTFSKKLEGAELPKAAEVAKPQAPATLNELPKNSNPFAAKDEGAFDTTGVGKEGIDNLPF